MKKSKKILHYEISLFVILIIVILISIVRINNYKSIYTSSSKYVKGIIKKYNIDGNKLNIEINSNENVIGVFHFSSKNDLLFFTNNFSIGDKVRIYGTFQRVKSNNSNILFDYRKYLEHRKIYYKINISKIELYSKNNNIFYFIKEKAIKRCRNNPYLLTFILGDKSKMDKEKLNIYQNLGISHLFSISGMHISLLTMILLFILKKDKYSYILVDIFLLFYLFLTGFLPSVMRSVLLFILLTINKNKLKVIDIFLITCILSLIFNPSFIYDISFIYSYIISFTLIMMSGFINRYDNYFLKILLCSFISIIVSIPITLYNFNQINLLSAIYNLLYIPFVSFIVFPISILSFIFPIFIPIFNISIRIMEYISIILSNYSCILSFKNVYLIFYLIYYVFIIIFLYGMYFNKKKLYLPLVFLIVIHYFLPNILNEDYVLMIDVGQGDSVLIHYHNKNILIDTGGILDYSKDKDWKKKNNQYSVVKSTTIPLLKKIGVREIHCLILTHGDYDHMGEAINLVNNFKVEKVIFNCGPYNDLEKELIKVLDKKKIKYYSCINQLDDLYFLQTKEYNNENDNSNVIYTELNGYKFMFMGDAGVEKEKDILNKYNISNIDVLKVGHHGSKTSSSKPFINEINPQYSIISVGKNNRYGHPNKEVLTTLEESKIYRTDKDGSIMFKIKNNKLKIETCSP